MFKSLFRPRRSNKENEDQEQQHQQQQQQQQHHQQQQHSTYEFVSIFKFELKISLFLTFKNNDEIEKLLWIDGVEMKFKAEKF